MGTAGLIGAQAYKSVQANQHDAKKFGDRTALVPGAGAGAGTGAGTGAAAEGAGVATGTGGTVTDQGVATVANTTPAIISSAPPPPAIAKLDPSALILHFQQISTFGLLSLNYPVLFESFTLNFSWANFIVIPSGHFKSFVNHLQKRDNSTMDTAMDTIDDFGQGLSGIEVYAAGLGINKEDISAIVFFVFLGVCAIFAALLLDSIILCKVLARVKGRKDPEKGLIWTERGGRVLQFASNNWIRLVRSHRVQIIAESEASLSRFTR